MPDHQTHQWPRNWSGADMRCPKCNKYLPDRCTCNGPSIEERRMTDHQTSPEKGFDPEAIMTKEEWIATAVSKLKPYLEGQSASYAASLYETYVEDDGEEWANDPEGAVAEDMSYWDNDE